MPAVSPAMISSRSSIEGRPSRRPPARYDFAPFFSFFFFCFSLVESLGLFCVLSFSIPLAMTTEYVQAGADVTEKDAPAAAPTTPATAVARSGGARRRWGW